VTGVAADHLAPTRRKMSQRLYEDLPRVLVNGTAHAYLKVSEGCSNPCTFCAIPQMRGKFRSRGIDSLVREAQALQQAGVLELNLVAQDTTRYGEDLGIRQGLTQLVETLLRETDFRWIRFLYAYPGSLDWSCSTSRRTCWVACAALARRRSIARWSRGCARSFPT
jgi:ribosomal protein S12 methylthiotransferase